jgi:hypothetical protein
MNTGYNRSFIYEFQTTFQAPILHTIHIELQKFTAIDTMYLQVINIQTAFIVTDEIVYL